MATFLGFLWIQHERSNKLYLEGTLSSLPACDLCNIITSSPAKITNMYISHPTRLGFFGRWLSLLRVCRWHPLFHFHPPIGTHLFWHSFLVWRIFLVEFFLVGVLRDTYISTWIFCIMHHDASWILMDCCAWTSLNDCCALHIKHVLFDHFLGIWRKLFLRCCFCTNGYKK